MKKTYKKPQVMVAVIENEMILAGSGGMGSLNNKPGYTGEGGQGGYAKQGTIDWDE